MNYLFEGKLDNTIHDISIDQVKYLYEENEKELQLSRRITNEEYNGQTAYNSVKDTRLATFIEYGVRQPRTDGVLIQYPYGTIIQQAESGHYYRGENQLFPESTPSLYRRLKQFSSEEEKNLYRLVADMRIGEFKSLLNKFNHVIDWDYCDILYDILAQHYGLETDWLDITSDFNIALFFATCFWDSIEKKWMPLTKKQTEIDEQHKYGMIFHIPSNRMIVRNGIALNYLRNNPFYSENSPNNVVYPIGFQPFMRCHMQSGYAMYMRKPHPLQTDIEFEKLRFRHDEGLSEWIFDKMEGGKLIYPHEGLNQVDFVIESIRNLTTFSKEAFQYALTKNSLTTNKDEEIIKKALQAYCINGKNVIIQDKPLWKLSSGRRQKINLIYRDFSIEDYYNIKLLHNYIYKG